MNNFSNEGRWDFDLLQFLIDTLGDYFCTTAQVDPVISPLLQRVLKASPHDVASFAAQALHQLALTGPSTATSRAS